MTEKRYGLVKDYDCDGNYEYAYQNNETGRRYNFADENCDYDFLNDVNNSYEKLRQENEQLKQSEQEFREYCNYLKSILEDNEILYD